MEDTELKGFFVWDPDASKRLGFGGYSDDPILFYQFPFEVSAVTVGEPEKGNALFMSDDSWNKEADRSPLKIDGMSAQESFRFFRQRALFENGETGECDCPRYIWLKTEYLGKEVFLFDDLYLDESSGRAKVEYPDGTAKALCGVPFSENNPLDHMTEEGNYDYEEIMTWPIIRIE